MTEQFDSVRIPARLRALANYARRNDIPHVNVLDSIATSLDLLANDLDSQLQPLSPSVAEDLAKTVFVNAVFNLNDEGFNYVAWQIYQMSKTAGGFTDHEGWARVRAAAEKLSYIAKTQAKFDERYKQLDRDDTDIGADVKGGGAQ